MRMLLVVLSQEVLAVVVAVRRAHDGVDVIPNGDARVDLAQAYRRLMVELDQDDRTQDPIVTALLTPPGGTRPFSLAGLTSEHGMATRFQVARFSRYDQARALLAPRP